MAGTIGESFDVIVVGAGNAAFAAALVARAEGARVVVLEKASHKLRGGNTRFTSGLFRCTYNSMDDPSTVAIDPYPHAAFQRDMDKVTSGRSDPELTAMLISRSCDTVRWMQTSVYRVSLIVQLVQSPSLELRRSNYPLAAHYASKAKACSSPPLGSVSPKNRRFPYATKPTPNVS